MITRFADIFNESDKASDRDVYVLIGQRKCKLLIELNPYAMLWATWSKTHNARQPDLPEML